MEQAMPLSSYKSLTPPRGGKLEYLPSLPKDFDFEKTYRTLIAIPPGEHTKSYVNACRNWFDHFALRNWIMVSLVTPDGRLFFHGAERNLPYLMGRLRKEIKLFGDRFYCWV